MPHHNIWSLTYPHNIVPKHCTNAGYRSSKAISSVPVAAVVLDAIVLSSLIFFTLERLTQSNRDLFYMISEITNKLHVFLTPATDVYNSNGKRHTIIVGYLEITSQFPYIKRTLLIRWCLIANAKKCIWLNDIEMLLLFTN